MLTPAEVLSLAGADGAAKSALALATATSLGAFPKRRGPSGMSRADSSRRDPVAGTSCWPNGETHRR